MMTTKWTVLILDQNWWARRGESARSQYRCQTKLGRLGTVTIDLKITGDSVFMIIWFSYRFLILCSTWHILVLNGLLPTSDMYTKPPLECWKDPFPFMALIDRNLCAIFSGYPNASKCWARPTSPTWMRTEKKIFSRLFLFDRTEYISSHQKKMLDLPLRDDSESLPEKKPSHIFRRASIQICSRNYAWLWLPKVWSLQSTSCRSDRGWHIIFK